MDKNNFHVLDASFDAISWIYRYYGLMQECIDCRWYDEMGNAVQSVESAINSKICVSLIGSYNVMQNPIISLIQKMTENKIWLKYH